MLCMWKNTDGRFCDRYTELVKSNLFLFYDSKTQSGLGHLAVEVSK